MLEKIFQKSGQADIVISLVFILLGVLLIAQTELVTSLISIILGSIALIIGIMRAIIYLKDGKENKLILSTAILLIVAGIVIMFFANIILEFFRILIAIWIIYTGVMNILKLISWKEYKSKLWIATLILALALLGIGIYVLLNPSAIMQTIGIIIIIYGVIDIIANIIFMNKLKELK